MSGKNAKLIRKYFAELKRLKAIQGASSEYRDLKRDYQALPKDEKNTQALFMGKFVE